MIKTLSTSFTATPAIVPGRTRDDETPMLVTDSRGESVPLSEPGLQGGAAKSGSGSGWAGKTVLMGVMAASAVLGPLGLSAASAAEPPHVTPTVQVDNSAASVAARFSDNSFQRGGPRAAAPPAVHFNSGNNFRATGGNTFRGTSGSSFRGFGTTGSAPRSFPTQRQSFPSQRENIPSQNFGRQGFPSQNFGRQGFAGQQAPGRVTPERGGFSQAGRGGQVTRDGRSYNSTTIVNNRYDSHNRIVNINNYGRDRWGGDGWRYNPYGFYAGNAFWAGYLLGEDWALMTDPYMFMQQPVYVVSPVTGDMCGQIEAPGGGAFDSQMAAQLGVLNVMANPQQNPNQPYDPTAGLYVDNGNFDSSNPGQKITSPAYAYNLLNHGQSVFFHPPNGDFEQLQGLGDLAPYIVTQGPATAQ